MEPLTDNIPYPVHWFKRPITYKVSIEVVKGKTKRAFKKYFPAYNEEEAKISAMKSAIEDFGETSSIIVTDIKEC